MKFSAALFSNALFATAILASPLSRNQRRAALSHKSNPLIPTTTVIEGNLLTNTSKVQYSDNWSGAVLTAPPAGQTFNAVSGRFVVPTPKAPSSGSGTWSASAWVGIDGDTYGNAILQSGVDFTVTVDGDSTSTSFDAWYEWYPDYAYDFSIAISAGDTIAISVASSSSSAGTVTLENVTTGKTVSKSLTAPSSSSDLGGQNAEWIVEDYESDGSLVSLANFGTVTFTDAVAKTSSESLGTTDATIIEIESGNTVLTDVTIPSSSEVRIVYE